MSTRIKIVAKEILTSRYRRKSKR